MRDKSIRSAHARPVMGGRPACPSARRVRGFTLIEALVATSVIGLGVAAVLVSAGSGTRVNYAGQQLTQATFLAQELREWTLRLPFSDTDSWDQNKAPGQEAAGTFDDLDDLDGTLFTPPRDGQGNDIAGMPGWSQSVELTWPDPDDLTATLAPPILAKDGQIIYVDVTISFRGEQVLRTGWLATRK